MPPKPAGLLRFSNARYHGDGTLSFRLDRQDGKMLAVSFPIEQLKDIINYFFGIARQVTRAEEREPLSGSQSVAALPIDAMEAGIGDDPERTILVARVGGFDLALSVPNAGLAELARDLARIAATVSASPGRRN